MEVKINVQTESGSENFDYNMTWAGGDIVSIAPEANIREAAKLMLEAQVGDVLVMETESEGGALLGILTDRDVALCLANEEDLEDLRVADVMTETVITGSVDDSVFKLIGIMKNAGVTRLPLVNSDDEVVGVATARNLLEILTKAFFDLTQIGEQQRQNELAHH